MKNLILPIVIVLLSGCVVAPVGHGSREVVVYPPVRISPDVEITYIWDPLQVRWYWVDRLNSRHYMDHDWKHPHGHRHDRKDDRRGPWDDDKRGPWDKDKRDRK